MTLLGYVGLFLSTSALLEIGVVLADTNSPALALVALAILGQTLPLLTILTRR